MSGLDPLEPARLKIRRYNGCMITLRAKFDGRVLIPEGPVDLPVGKVLEVQVEERAESASAPLAELADWAEALPSNPEAPTDGAEQHDHYLYGTPKRP